ncbi:hypothetical protein ABES58_21350 [Paenibacillus lautus]|uniref:hypothetical protein n=1 Tax=Paenibacillus lautus TaxID=1401 RepID=UPI003D26D15A
MKTTFSFPLDNILAVYNSIKIQLNGFDSLIFRAMSRIDSTFATTDNPTLFIEKHEEIIRLLEWNDHNQSYAMSFFEAICTEARTEGLFSSNLVECIRLNPTLEGAYYTLSVDLHWCVNWELVLSTRHISRTIQVEEIGPNFKIIVPNYIIEYLHNAITAFKQKINTVAVALISIAVEATLRDVLKEKGFTYNPRDNELDTYHSCDATISTDSNKYTITYNSLMPKGIPDFLTSTNGLSSVNVKIRRVLKKTSGGRIRTDIQIIGVDDIVDHLTIDSVEKNGSITIGGLGKALSVARGSGFLTPATLPVAFDDVITGVRNNLIHLSNDSLNQPVAKLGNISINDFLKDDDKVYTLLTFIPRFINEQYKLIP